MLWFKIICICIILRSESQNYENQERSLKSNHINDSYLLCFLNSSEWILTSELHVTTQAIALKQRLLDLYSIPKVSVGYSMLPS